MDKIFAPISLVGFEILPFIFENWIEEIEALPSHSKLKQGN